MESVVRRPLDIERQSPDLYRRANNTPLSEISAPFRSVTLNQSAK